MQRCILIVGISHHRAAPRHDMMIPTSYVPMMIIFFPPSSFLLLLPPFFFNLLLFCAETTIVFCIISYSSIIV